MSIRYQFGLSVAAIACLWLGGISVAATPQEELVSLHQQYVAKVAPLSKEAKEAWWESSTIGSDASYARREKANNDLAAMYQDAETFAKLKQLRDSKAITDPMLKRELDTMYFEYLPYQVDPELSKQINALETEVDKLFNVHRSEVQGQKLTENDVRKILIETTDSEKARQAWQGYMAVGDKVAGPLYKLVKLRNEMARKLGYRDYFAMQLDLQELEEDELMRIFDELDQLTLPAFKELKGRIDAHMAKRFGIKASEVRPWHLGDLFFQEAPMLSKFDADAIYAGKDPVKLSTKYYKSFGLDPTAIISRSDLYERPNKSPHAFQECMDRAQDIRVLCNIKPNAAWMDTINHELGHGLYDQHINQDIPYTLRTASHIMTTEGIAMLMGEMTRTRDFLENVVDVPADKLDEASQANWEILRSERLIFCRWVLTMLHFEQEMYKNPDQDLNKLWWSLKAKYQLQSPPINMKGHDYGAKMHVVGAPVYYHNYMLGDLFACQLYDYISTEVMGCQPLQSSFYGHPEVSDFLKNKVFAPGNLYNWNDLTIHATGQPLSAKSFARIYVNAK